MQSNEQKVTSELSGDEFWRAHLMAREKFSGTDREYCQQRGLNYGSFSSYKSKLGFSRPHRRKKAFVEVKSQSAVVKPEQRKSPQPQSLLPDAKWLAEFAQALMRHR